VDLEAHVPLGHADRARDRLADGLQRKAQGIALPALLELAHRADLAGEPADAFVDTPARLGAAEFMRNRHHDGLAHAT
jgi:hypothetical protein